MGTHWPVFVAIALISAAVALGIKRQADLEKSAQVITEYRKVPKAYDPNAVPAAKTAPANNTPAITKVVHVNEPAVTPKVPPGFTAVQPPTQPTVVTQPERLTPPANIQPNQFNQPNGAMQAAPADRNSVFAVLRMALQQRFGTAPMVTNNGFAVVVDGARIDVDATANWSIVIFNNTKAQPPAQTENFLAIQNIVATTLEMDLNGTAPRTTGDGKTVRRPSSKLGKVVAETDPAMFNSMTIKPYGRTNFPAANPGNTPTARPVRPGVNPFQPQPNQPGQVQPTQPKVATPGMPARPKMTEPVIKVPPPPPPPAQPKTPAQPTTDQF